MKKILLISDTHGHLPNGFWKYLESVDEVWHAGDVGGLDLIDRIGFEKPIKGVYGNIDGQNIRKVFTETLTFIEQGVKVAMVHIGGKPGRYDQRAYPLIKQFAPNVFICGHSHILKVMYDKKENLLYLNPGAMGRQGFHQVKTCLRFTLKEGKVENMEVIEFEK